MIGRDETTGTRTRPQEDASLHVRVEDAEKIRTLDPSEVRARVTAERGTEPNTSRDLRAVAEPETKSGRSTPASVGTSTTPRNG